MGCLSEKQEKLRLVEPTENGGHGWETSTLSLADTTWEWAGTGLEMRGYALVHGSALVKLYSTAHLSPLGVFVKIVGFRVTGILYRGSAELSEPFGERR